MAAIALSAELAKTFDKLETLAELGETYIKAPPALDGPDLTESGDVKPHELDATQFKTSIKGSLLISHTNEIHAVPHHSAVQSGSDEDKFRIAKNRRMGTNAWVTSEYATRTTMEMNYKGALLGILSEKKSSGAHADTVRAGGLPAKISVHPGDSIKELAIEINGGDAQILPVKDVLTLTNKSWQSMLPESEDAANDMGDIPNRAALKDHMVEWQKLDNLAIPDMRKSILIRVAQYTIHNTIHIQIQYGIIHNTRTPGRCIIVYYYRRREVTICTGKAGT